MEEYDQLCSENKQIVQVSSPRVQIDDSRPYSFLMDQKYQELAYDTRNSDDKMETEDSGQKKQELFIHFYKQSDLFMLGSQESRSEKLLGQA